MVNINTDPFWDGRTGGGVRCSSEGENAGKYLDPSSHAFEGNGGRSIASLLPSSHGLRGVVIPRATAFGGSRGFDPQKPRLVNIDPDIKGQACVVDLSQITKEKMEQAFLKASQNPLTQTDIRLLAAQTFHNLAVGYEPVGMRSAPVQPTNPERRAPLGSGLGTYVVPRADLGGGQMTDEPVLLQTVKPTELMSPSVQPRGPVLPPGMKVASTQTVVDLTDRDAADNIDEINLDQVEVQEMPARPNFKDQSTRPARKVNLQGSPTQKQLSPAGAIPPSTNVVFEMEGWGTFEAAYHEVIKQDELLVLVYDTKFKGGMKFFPQASKNLIAVKIEGSDSVFFVNCYGNRFQHGGFEYCILVIDQEGNTQNTPTDA